MPYAARYEGYIVCQDGIASVLFGTEALECVFKVASALQCYGDSLFAYIAAKGDDMPLLLYKSEKLERFLLLFGYIVDGCEHIFAQIDLVCKELS